MERRRWEEMESDCLVNIFQRLGLEDLTLGVPLVCMSWCRASLDPLCWKSLDFRPLHLMPWSVFTKTFTTQYSVPRFSFTGFLKLVVSRSCGSVVDLRFPLLFGASLKDLVYASNECPRLKVLVLPNLLPADEVHIPELIGKWKDLERVEMESKPSSFPDMASQINLHCKRFSGLKVCGPIEKQDALAIVDYLPKLKCLWLSKSYLAKEELLEIVNGCKELERLSVNDCVGFEADYEVLKRASGIKIFEYEGCRAGVDYGFDFVI